MRLAFWIFLSLALVSVPVAVRADEATRNTQIALKNRGFYYGNVDGVGGPETEAAVRRFQIRQGLKVTGTLTEETAQKLNRPASASAPSPTTQYGETDREFLESAPAPRSTPAPTPRYEPTPPRYTERVERREDRYLPPNPDPQYESYRDSYAVPAPIELESPQIEYADVFLGTIFENAPRDLQQDVFRDAQARLARLRYYAGDIDGIPGPATEEAIAGFQNDGRRRLTGRLDTSTLSDLGLISRRRSRAVEYGYESGGSTSLRIYRGVPIR